MATLAPSAANRTAIACPIPDDAPVINTFFPCNRSILPSYNFRLHLLHPCAARRYSLVSAGIFRRSSRIESRMQMTRRVALMLGLAAMLPAFAQSKVDPVNKDGSGVAIKGYDPVAYFTQSKPVKGSASFTHQWMNSTWWFASAEDRDEFARMPEK